MPTSAELRPVLLFLHFVAIAGALGTSAVMHHALVRLRAARRTPEALQAMQVLKARGPRMPLWALALFATGAGVAQSTGAWGQPFVGAGILGLVAMLAVSGAVLKRRMSACAQRLVAAGDAPIAGDLAVVVRDPLVWAGALINPAIAYAVMFDMVVKPGALGCAAAIGVAILGAIAVSIVGRPSVAMPAAEQLPTEG